MFNIELIRLVIKLKELSQNIANFFLLNTSSFYIIQLVYELIVVLRTRDKKYLRLKYIV